MSHCPACIGSRPRSDGTDDDMGFTIEPCPGVAVAGGRRGAATDEALPTSIRGLVPDAISEKDERREREAAIAERVREACALAVDDSATQADALAAIRALDLSALTGKAVE